MTRISKDLDISLVTAWSGHVYVFSHIQVCICVKTLKQPRHRSEKNTK